MEKLLSGELKSGVARRQVPGKGLGPGVAERGSASVKVFDPNKYVQDTSLCSWQGLHDQCALGNWTKFYKTDPRVALGKYSPLEKEILHLGGVHSVAARRFLTQKQRDEQKQLRELKQRCWGSELKLRCSRLASTPCVGLQKAWSARVQVPPTVLQLPPRELATISRHVERMRLAREPQDRNPRLGAGSERLKGFKPPPGAALDQLARDEGREEWEKESRPGTPSGQADEAQDGGAKKPRIKMTVTFKDEEPPKDLSVRPSQEQSRDPRERAKWPRPPHTTGLAHQNRLAVADFPGDLLLMAQSFTAWGMHAGDLPGACHPEEESVDGAQELPGTY